MDNQQKKDLAEVLKGHHRSKWDVTKSYLKKVRTGAVLGVGLDLLFTGGFGTVVAASAATLPALKAAFRSAASRGVMVRTLQQQKIKAPADVIIVLAEIETSLGNAFQAATKPVSEATPDAELDIARIQKQQFLAIADAREQEVNKLRPAIRILAGGTNNYGTDELKINLTAFTTRGGNDWRHVDVLTLEEARAEIVKDLSDIEQLQAARKEKRLEDERQAQERARKAAEVKKPRGFNV